MVTTYALQFIRIKGYFDLRRGYHEKVSRVGSELSDINTTSLFGQLLNVYTPNGRRFEKEIRIATYNNRNDIIPIKWKFPAVIREAYAALDVLKVLRSTSLLTQRLSAKTNSVSGKISKSFWRISVEVFQHTDDQYLGFRQDISERNYENECKVSQICIKRTVSSKLSSNNIRVNLWVQELYQPSA